MINIILWKWRQPGSNKRLAEYEAVHVDTMVSMLKRNIKLTHRIICITDDPSGIMECETFPLWPDCGNLANATRNYLPSCYRRLKLYDRQTQIEMGIRFGERIVSIDLDTLILGNLDALLRTEGRFISWELPGQDHAKVFNGSLQMFNAGDLQDIWSSFDPSRSPRAAALAGFRGSDQAWLSWRLVGMEGSVGLKWPIIASYPSQVLIQRKALTDTKLIFFHGTVKPWYPEARAETPWVSQYWR